MVIDESKRVEREALRRLGPAGRLAVAQQLYQTARQLKEAGLRDQHPDWTDEQIREKVRELFLYARS